MLTRRELAALAVAAAAAPVVGCGYPRSEKARVWADAGTLADLPEGRWYEVSVTLEGAEDLPPLYVYARRHGDRAEVMSRRCTHVGCPVRYVEHSDRFICPCHGAVYDDRGRPVGGPAKQPLERWDSRVRDGRLQVAPRPSSAAGEKS